MILNTNTAINPLHVKASELGRTPMQALQAPAIAGEDAGLPVFTGEGGVLTARGPEEARAALDAAKSTHGHGAIRDDGKVGDAAGLPLFTGPEGEVGTKSIASAREALGLGNTSGPLPLENGGTGAANAAAAREALGVLALPSRFTELPASGTPLEDHAEYRPLSPLGTYAFAWPEAPFACWLRFTTAAECNITFPQGTACIGGIPEFAASTEYEMSVKDGVVIVQEVTTV